MLFVLRCNTDKWTYMDILADFDTLTWGVFVTKIPNLLVEYIIYICIIFPPSAWWQSSYRFDFSGKGDDKQQEETDENKRVHVVSKLHAILRPFLLRRMKEDVEHMLPRKKEIIIYANMTEHQKQIQNHLIGKTFDNYLHENTDISMHVFLHVYYPICAYANKIQTWQVFFSIL
jgi:hypothetical protein